MEPLISQAKILKINHAILSDAAMLNHSLFNSLVTSMREHVKDRSCEVEIYTEEFDGKHQTGEETEHLFDSLEILNTWLKTTYPNNV